MEYKDYYKLLGVAKTASAEEIKKAYRKLARKHHPDLSKAPDATERMAALNEANAVLGNPDKRLAYDSLSAEGRAPPGRDFRPPPNWDAGFEFSEAAGDSGNGSGVHSDFFEQLFGRAARSQAHAGQFDDARAANTSKRGSDHHAKIELNLLDAFSGAERTIVLRSARLADDGSLVPEERSLQVKIPKGVHQGQHIRLAGRGGSGHGSAPAGDLLLEVLFKPDTRWRAEGRDLYQRVPLAPWEAALGVTAQVQTPGGTVEVNFPSGWKTERKLRLKGRGIPSIGSSAVGDLYLEPELRLPAADSDTARAAYAALANAFPTFQPRSHQPASGV